MKRTLACIVVLSAVLTFSPLAHAAGPRILIEHKLTGFKKADSSVTLEYSLHVTNPGSTPVSDLTLSLVPRSNFIRNGLTLKIGYLGPGQDATLPLQVATPLPINPRWAGGIPLSWRGKYLDADGKTVAFPAVSKGGAR